ncbi:general secretion pathway protein GspK [Luteibacter aegosomatissinici]|uniref:general secretion pathway protein GspK n=1 Tax=Luteibacter aegosomatissinici TaxID=2911539 RepID=UPI001FF9F8C3|nr:type II secretion system protein GspK [Luteibacter aegosomatissinici]UPG92945.1 general secretion pathway protein GspK [Luteibacter aegosomatissinici]
MLAILVGGFASIARTEALQTRFSLGQQRARYAAEAGMMQAIALTEARRGAADAISAVPSADAGLPGDGRAVAFAFEHIKVAVAMMDETGKVDLNTASTETLRRLFLGVGCTATRTDTIVTAINAWRGPVVVSGDDAAVLSGRLAMGAADPAHYAPFFAVEQLQGVEGMDPALYELIEPLVTVWSGRPVPEPDFAPAGALASLPGVDPATAREVVAIRDAAPQGTILPNLPGGLTLGGALPGNTVTFRVDADDGAGNRSQIEATVQFPPHGVKRDPRVPLYTILRWRDGPPG